MATVASHAMLSSMKQLLAVSLFTVVTPVLILVAGGAAIQSCTPQARTAISTAVKVAVDTCAEIEDSGAAEGWIALTCAVVDVAGPEVEVLLSETQWNSMKRAYLAEHGRLPPGMKAP